jgi:hypothetical protein
MQLKIIDNERKTIRKEFKKYNKNDHGIILLIDKTKKSKITFVLDEMNKILSNNNTEFYYDIHSTEDIKNVNSLVANGKTVITNIRLDNESDLVPQLKLLDSAEYLKFLNNLNVILK